VWARAGKEVLSERLVAYGPCSEELAWSDFGVTVLCPVDLQFGLKTPENPTTWYGVIAMGLEGRTSGRAFRIDPPRN